MIAVYSRLQNEWTGWAWKLGRAGDGTGMVSLSVKKGGDKKKGRPYIVVFSAHLST